MSAWNNAIKVLVKVETLKIFLELGNFFRKPIFEDLLIFLHSLYCGINKYHTKKRSNVG